MAKDAKEPVGLSTAEWAVMKVVWEDGPLATGDIYARLAERERWAYPTEKTLIRRLVAKGWIEYRRVGNSFLYRPAVGRGKAVQSAIREFSNRVLDGLLSPFVAYYAEQDKLSPADIAQLEEILKRHREKGGR